MCISRRYFFPDGLKTYTTAVRNDIILVIGTQGSNTGGDNITTSPKCSQFLENKKKVRKTDRRVGSAPLYTFPPTTINTIFLLCLVFLRRLPWQATAITICWIRVGRFLSTYLRWSGIQVPSAGVYLSSLTIPIIYTYGGVIYVNVRK